MQRSTATVFERDTIILHDTRPKERLPKLSSSQLNKFGPMSLYEETSFEHKRNSQRRVYHIDTAPNFPKDASTKAMRTKAMVEAMVQTRFKQGGSAYDDKIMKQARAKSPRLRRSRTTSPKLQMATETLSEAEPGGCLPLFLQYGDKYAQQSTAPVFTVLERKKPEKKATRRHRNMRLVCAAYMPRVKEPDRQFDDEARGLGEKTGFTTEQVQHFFEEFDAFAKRRVQNGPPMMDFYHFGKLMAKHKVTDKRLRTSIFELYDADDSGLINFEEFLKMLALFKSGTRELQARAVFQLCDIDGDKRTPYHEKTLQKFELLRFVSQGLKDKSDKKMMNGLAKELFELLDRDGSGDVTWDEFSSKVETDNEVWRCLTMLSPFTRHMTNADAVPTQFGSITI